MIDFKNINLTFDNKIIFKDYSLKIEKGEKILLHAPSGKGKSSLVKMLLGFIQPDSGEIFFNNYKLNKSSLQTTRQNISYVSQDVDLIDDNTGELIKQIFSYKCNKHIDFNLKKLKMMLSAFQLEENILRKNTNELSGGERQRIGLIICFLLDREVWILDEVTSALDAQLKEKVIKQILATNKTMLIISHDHQWLQDKTIKVVKW